MYSIKLYKNQKLSIVNEFDNREEAMGKFIEFSDLMENIRYAFDITMRIELLDKEELILELDFEY